MDPPSPPPDGLAPPDPIRARIMGRAVTTPGHASIADADPVEPARAVRRALAQAGRKAVEVDQLWIAAPVAPTVAACRTLARRALGPHGSEIQALGVAGAGETAETLAIGAAAAMDATAVGLWDLAVCVGLAADGTAVALCLVPATP